MRKLQRPLAYHTPIREESSHMGVGNMRVPVLVCVCVGGYVYLFVSVR